MTLWQKLLQKLRRSPAPAVVPASQPPMPCPYCGEAYRVVKRETQNPYVSEFQCSACQFKWYGDWDKWKQAKEESRERVRQRGREVFRRILKTKKP